MRDIKRKIIKISAIVPALNEEKTIGGVLSILSCLPEIDEIIVVNDGSDDRTAKIVSSYPNVVLINLKKNCGKGAAVKVGLNYSHGDIILLLDADLIGLRSEHIYQLLKPVISDKAVMSLGLFQKGRKITDLSQKINPHLSGQRAIRRDVLEKINDLDTARFGLEIAITKQVESQRLPIVKVELYHLTHVTKEEKRGILKGFVARLKMYWEIIRYYVKYTVK